MNTYLRKCVLFPGLNEAVVEKHSLFFLQLLLTY